MPPPINQISRRCYAQDSATNDPRPELVRFLRDRLPPWPDTIWGYVGGGIGETCIPVLALVGLGLMHRGYVRWQLPTAMLATVAALACIWPVVVVTQSASGAGDHTLAWLPILHAEDGLAVGAAVVLFHLTGGGLWLAALLIATDPVTSPLNRRGQVWFGVGLGGLIMIARCNPWFPALPGAEYWAILGMNTLVPLIDRMSARRVLGT